MSNKGNKITKPSHYTSGDIECIEAIESALTREQYIGFLKGQMLKYVWRCGLKDSAFDDARKARFYVQRLIELLEIDPDPIPD